GAGVEQRLGPYRAELAERAGDDAHLAVEGEPVTQERASSVFSIAASTSYERKSSSKSAFVVTRPSTCSSSYGGMPPPRDFMTTSAPVSTWPAARSRAMTRLLPILTIGARSLS